MRIGVLTSSRADFGIYLSLLQALRNDDSFRLGIIAFGTHLSSFHGMTQSEIEEHGFKIDYRIESMLLTDSPDAVATTVGLTCIRFADFWKSHKDQFDIVLCLGDRYEMFAAVMAGVPFGVRFAHLHGGESTLGAIDNIFRHAITIASELHFVSTETHYKRVAAITGKEQGIYNVGAISLDKIGNMPLLTPGEFLTQWGVDLETPTILTTFHPETVTPENTSRHVTELINAINALTSNYQVLVTMPNADSNGTVIRDRLITAFGNSSTVKLRESLGAKGYFTALKYCSLLMGNTSSGIIEAASFGKYVVDIGDRQKGRDTGLNVLHAPIDATSIIEKVHSIASLPKLQNDNIYYRGGAASNIVQILKERDTNDRF